ncbi:hypothetical protein [Streptomyces beijiangensis]|uniref:Scaffolding protein n=1 Tax=Streptomyces beijiangensis TaxID=163361 RepID=A0A939F655_9ACTN|nr:hypothetical protein [Streptomyces beijiangensis]MBO0512424.1 hypothetical protein [Streptomyces beijiangensis]
MSRLLPHPHAVLGFRKDGRPIHPILGASEGDPSSDPSPQGGTTVDQDTLSRLLAREKQQGERTGIKQLLEGLGFEKPEDLTQFVAAQREAQTAALSEIERREQAATQRAQEADQRIAAASARERVAQRRAALLGLGALGDDLVDAEALLRAAVADDADETAVTEAAEALKVRRPTLFGTQHQESAPAPGGSPAGGGPKRSTPTPPGKAGVDMARRRGYISE